MTAPLEEIRKLAVETLGNNGDAGFDRLTPEFSSAVTVAALNALGVRP